MREETIEKPNEYHIAEAVVVPVDDVMEICPGDGELLTFELDGETKTFLFEHWPDERAGNCCDFCELNKRLGNSKINKKLCGFVCSDNGYALIAKEYVQEGDKFVRAGGGRQDKQEPAKKAKKTEKPDKRAQWEAAQAELAAIAKREEGLEYAAKTTAKIHRERAKKARAAIYALAESGSENYQSATPLFDLINDDSITVGDLNRAIEEEME
jgi:hypothetical protein